MKRRARVLRVLAAAGLLAVLAGCENSATSYMIDGSQHGRHMAERRVTGSGQHAVQTLRGFVDFLSQRLKAHSGIHEITQDQL